MATTVRTAKKYDKLTPGMGLMVRSLEGRPIPKTLERELKRLYKIEQEKKAKRKVLKKGYAYIVRGIKGEKTTITARNAQDAVNKAARIYPKAKLLGVERVSRTGREYETTWVKR